MRWGNCKICGYPIKASLIMCDKCEEIDYDIALKNKPLSLEEIKVNKYDSYSVTEEMIEKAEKFFGVNSNRGESLEAFTIGKDSDRVLMKVSSPRAYKDLAFANLISARMVIEEIAMTNDGRNITISTDDFMKLFGEDV